MPRDQKIKKHFEIADDGMQGVIGYFHYVFACQKAASTDDTVGGLPPQTLQITYEWGRFYDRADLCREMGNLFPAYHARIALISLISIFEGALSNFTERLVETHKILKPQRSYKARLVWAFDVASQSTFGSDAMRNRITEICLHVDHARRLRNLWMHNNGLYDDEYEKGIEVNGNPPVIEPDYYEYKKNRRAVAVTLKPDAFPYLAYSHVELLHHLHDTIQRVHFGQKRPYGYEREKKVIEWHRLLIGL